MNRVSCTLACITLAACGSESRPPPAEPTNTAPTASVAAIQLRHAGETVALDASASKDPDGDSLTFSWRQTGGAAALLVDWDTARASFVAPEADDTLTFEVTVEDGHGGSASEVQPVRVVSRATLRRHFAEHPFRDHLPSYPPEAFAYDAARGLVHAAAGNEVVTVDFSEPSVMVEVASCTLPASVYDLAFDGRYVYAAASTAGLIVVDPLAGEDCVLGSYAPDGVYASRVVVTGGVAYLPRDLDGLDIVDVSDPRQPVLVGNDPYRAPDVALAGSLLHVAGWTSAGDHWGLRILDVTDPRAPAFVGEYDFGTSVYLTAVYVDGTRAFVPTSATTMAILDTSDPAAPTHVADFTTEDNLGDILLGPNRMYRSDRYGFHVQDTTDPTDIVTIGELGPFASVYGLGLAGDYLLAGCEGIWAIDLRRPLPRGMASLGATPLAPATTTEAIARSVRAAGTYVHAATSNGYYVFDVADPTAPSRILTYHAGTFYDDVAVAGGVAFLTRTDVVDAVAVANPSLPVSLASATFAGVHGVTAVGATTPVAVHAVGTSGLRSYQFDGVFTQTGEYVAPTGASAYAVEVSGSYAYVADSRGLRVLALSPFSPPALTAVVVSGSSSNAAALALGDVGPGMTPSAVYSSSWSLHAVQLTSPVFPYEYGAMGSSVAGSHAVAISDRLIFVAEGDRGLSVIAEDGWGNLDVVASYATGGRASAVAAVGRTAYVGTDALLVFDVTQPQLTVVTAPAGVGSTAKYTLGWTDHAPATDERLACLAATGSCEITDVDQAAHTAAVAWTVGSEYDQVSVAVGNENYFERVTATVPLGF